MTEQKYLPVTATEYDETYFNFASSQDIFQRAKGNWKRDMYNIIVFIYVFKNISEKNRLFKN